MRRVAKKSRIIDYCLAKGNDTRVNVNDTDPENPIYTYPVFRFQDLTNQPTLDYRSKIIQDDEILNQRVVRGVNTSFIGDNKQRNQYPSGTLELHFRIHKNERNKNQRVGFLGNNNVNNIDGYRVQYVDSSPLEVARVETAVGHNVDSLSINKELEILSVYTSSIPTLDLSENNELITISMFTGILNALVLPTVKDKLRTLDIQRQRVHNITDLSDYIELVTIRLGGAAGQISPATSNQIGDFDTSNMTNLRILNVGNTNRTECYIEDNIGTLRELWLGVSNTGTNTNNIGHRHSGIDDMALAEVLIFSGSAIIIPNFDINNYPLLNRLEFISNNVITGTLKYVNPNLNFTDLYINSAVNLIDLDFNDFPNLKRIRLQGSLSFTEIDYSSLTKLNDILISSSQLTGKIDLSNINQTINLYFSIVGTDYKELNMPAVQITAGTFQFYNNNFHTITGLNSISRTNTALQISKNNLSVLDTSFGTGNCFPNLTQIAVGGPNDTYTSTKVFDDRKNEFSTLVVEGSVFQTTGNLGNDLGKKASLINIGGDSNLSYNSPGTFPATMRRVSLRPKLTSGLATDGDQVANLIIDLSTKAWTTTANANFSGTNYAYRIIDLRGNCATPTPSQALTDAITLLNTKNVSTLTN